MSFILNCINICPEQTLLCQALLCFTFISLSDPHNSPWMCTVIISILNLRKPRDTEYKWLTPKSHSFIMLIQASHQAVCLKLPTHHIGCDTLSSQMYSQFNLFPRLRDICKLLKTMRTFMLSQVSQTHTAWFQLHEVPRGSSSKGKN